MKSPFHKSLVDNEINYQPFVHVTSRIRASNFCTAPCGMVAKVPGRKNEIIAWNLRQDPAEALDLDGDGNVNVIDLLQVLADWSG